jgi:peptidoglycan hydrolase CwlO-like protein
LEGNKKMDETEKTDDTHHYPFWVTPITVVMFTAIVSLTGVGIGMYATIQTNSNRLTTIERDVNDINQYGSRHAYVLEEDVKNIRQSLEQLRESDGSINDRINRLEDRINNIHGYITQMLPPHTPSSGASPTTPRVK